MTDNSNMKTLADACERHAQRHFTIALGNLTETAVDLSNIDRGLECLERARTLRREAAQ